MRESKYGLPALNTLGFLVMVTINTLANALPINDITTGEVSARYDNLFVPAGFTFSIWGVIYLLLAVFVAYQWVVSRQDSGVRSFTDKVGIWFFVSCLANAGWIFAWHYEVLALSLILMLLLLACLLAIYLRLGIGVTRVTRGEKYLVHLPFSVYLGWITIATIANVSALLVSIQWDALGLDPQFWTVAVVTVGIAIALAMAIRRQDIYFCLVIVWALLGILMKRLGDPVTPDQAVVAATIAGICVVSVAIIVQVARSHVYGQTIT